MGHGFPIGGVILFLIPVSVYMVFPYLLFVFYYFMTDLDVKVVQIWAVRACKAELVYLVCLLVCSLSALFLT